MKTQYFLTEIKENDLSTKEVSLEEAQKAGKAYGYKIITYEGLMDELLNDPSERQSR